ncbi:MAG: hypothetical protein COA78_27655 [Blastopirellula sp.]|nr:MAG: hypothetical protein COA78_27655 [Blastopirellula sp.]
MKYYLNNCILVLIAFCFFTFAPVALAEYPGLETVIKPEIRVLAKSLSDKTVLVSLPDPAELNRRWRLTAAVETEIVAQLLGAGIDAVDEDTDERFTWLAKTNAKSVKRWQLDPVYDALVTGEFRLNNSKTILKLMLSVYYKKRKNAVYESTIDLKPSDAMLSANVSLQNASVANFMKFNRGKMIGEGICATAATEALKHAKCERFGLYDWGRRLGPNEALLPGDIVQYEYATFRKGVKESTLVHHTAIIHEIIDSDSFKVLHQNVGGADVKKTVTEATIDMSQHTGGSVVFFRPTLIDNLLPNDPTPFRKSAATIVKTKQGHIDLLQTVDPELDSVHGIWGKWNGPICSHKDKFLKLQIPVDLPDSYTIRAKIKRTWGNDTYGMILKVGGHQCLLSLDAYAGTVCGLDMVGGKKVHSNPTTKRIKNVLPMERTVALTVVVTPSTVQAEINGTEVVNWSGDASELSLQESWQVPNKAWLHLGAYLSVFDTESLTMEIH